MYQKSVGESHLNNTSNTYWDSIFIFYTTLRKSLSFIFKLWWNRCINYAEIPRVLLNGKPLIIRKFRTFFKVTIRPSAIKQLNREVRNGTAAMNWRVYAGRAIALKKMTPFVAKCILINEKSTISAHERFTQKINHLAEISIKNTAYVINASQQSASEVINAQITKLNIDINKNDKLHKELRKFLNSGYFSYTIPVTPMHGDFIPSNAILKGDKLYLIDWEYALSNGSLLYDWWRLKKEIVRNEVDNSKVKGFIVFLDYILSFLNISHAQFDAFGCAMDTVINLSRSEVRNSIDFNNFNDYFNKLQAIVFSSKQQSEDDYKLVQAA